MRFRILLISFLFLGLGSLFAQSTKRGSDQYTFTYSADNYTRTQAIAEGIKDAKIKLLIDTFGTDLQMDSYTRIENSSGNMSVNTNVTKEEQTRGIWVETTTEEATTEFDAAMARWIVKVRIGGIMRERIKNQARPEFIIKTLNAPNVNAEATIIKSATNTDVGSSNFFIYFKSPVDGYIAAYMVDMNNTAYRLVPYNSLSEQQIKPRLEYIFLHDNPASIHSNDWSLNIPSITLTCDDVAEHYKLYVIFSTHHFTIPMDDGGEIPTLSEDSFRKWMNKGEKADDAFYITPIDITIKK